jgi:hypothetical protein
MVPVARLIERERDGEERKVEDIGLEETFKNIESLTISAISKTNNLNGM